MIIIKKICEIKAAEKQHYDFLSKMGKQYLDEGLSDNSKKRQAYLLISAVVAILLSKAFIIPLESNVQGFKFNFSGPQTAAHLAGGLCLYFLVIFIIGAVQDRRREEFGILIINYQVQDYYNKLMELNDIKKDLTKAHWLDILSRVNSSLQGNKTGIINSLINGYISALNKIDETVLKLNNQQNFRFILLNNSPTNKISQYINDLQSIEKLIAKQEKIVINKIAKVDPTILNDERKITTGLWTYIVAQEFDRRMTEINNAQNLYQFYKNLRNLIEVLFPCAFSVYAIFISLFR
jgi:hypothetical protein